jgi:site-specific DNA-methyltransferase (adenine-specific)
LVWSECHRVLHKGCRLCINIGDEFARSVYYGRYKVIPIRTEIIKFCENYGFDYMGSIIWQKVTTCNTTGGATIMGSYPYPRNGIIKLDYEFILIFKKYGNAPNVSKEIKELSKLTNEEWNQYFVGHWNFSGEKQDKHLAMFPEELPKRLIKMFSFVGETILDPFLGSGTTSLAAKKLNRNSIGYEINEDFLPIIKEKLDIDKKEIFNENIYEIIKQNNFDNNYKERINKLPYIFNDPIKFDKKIDPKKFNFGSKIDNTENYKNKFYTVTDIISPEVLILDNQLKIRLLGIKEIFEKRNEAIAFLNEKIYKQKVFIKYDNIKYDENDNLLCYLFLKNGMFINNYLVKKGLADIDEKYNFIYKTKFQNLKNKISIK